MGECGRVLEMHMENFSRMKSARSGFHSTCKTCNNADYRARYAKKRARVKPEHVVELPGYDDDDEVISD